MATLIEETVRIQADIAALSEDFATVHRMLHWMLPRQLQVVDVGTSNIVAVLTLAEISVVDDGTGRWLPRWASGGDSLFFDPAAGTWVLNAPGYSGWLPDDQLLGRYSGMTTDENGDPVESPTHFVVAAGSFYEGVWANTQANVQRLVDWLRRGLWVTSNENNSISGFYVENGMQNGQPRYLHINPSAQTGASANYPRIFYNSGTSKWELQFSATQPASQNLQSTYATGDYTRAGQTVTAYAVSMYAMASLVYGHARQQEARRSIEQPGALLDQTKALTEAIFADYARRTGDYPTASQTAAAVAVDPTIAAGLAEITSIDQKIPANLGITLTDIEEGVAALTVVVPSDLAAMLTQIVARLSGAAITVQSPTAASGELELTQGDSYSVALGNSVEFELGDDLPDLSTAAAYLEILKLSDGSSVLYVQGTIVGDPGAWELIYFELTGAETEALAQVDQRAYEYKVVLVFPTAQRTIARGDCRVRR